MELFRFVQSVEFYSVFVFGERGMNMSVYICVANSSVEKRQVCFVSHIRLGSAAS